MLRTTTQGFAYAVTEGRRLAKKLGDKQVLFMCNHGILVAAPSVAVAFDALYYVERACMYQVSCHYELDAALRFLSRAIGLTSKKGRSPCMRGLELAPRFCSLILTFL